MTTSTECRIASLMAFSQSRNCGNGSGGFQAGNKCATGDGGSKPSWMGPVDASGGTPHGKWFLEKNTKGLESPGHGDVTSHVISLVGDDGKIKAFMHADASDDHMYVNYSQVDKPHRGKGVYKSLLSSLSEKFTVHSDEDHNVHPYAAKAYKSLGAEVDRYGGYVLKKKSRESRNCGNGSGGFQKGNTCASGKLADAAEGAVSGAIKGAAVALGVTGPVPQFVAKGAAIGAATGAVKGLYDNHMQPTRIMKQIEKIGSSEKQVASLVKRLGGSTGSVAKVSGGKLSLAVKDKSGKKLFDVAMGEKQFVVTPARKSGTLTSSEMSQVKKIAEENSPKDVSVLVKSRSPSYLSSLVKKGFKVTANAAGDVVATVAIPLVPGVVGTVVAVAAEKLQKKKS